GPALARSRGLHPALTAPGGRMDSRWWSGVTGHRDDDVALLVTGVDVPVGVGDPLQWVARVDHRDERRRLGELGDGQQIPALLAGSAQAGECDHGFPGPES